jgi:phosphopentomutase
MHYGHRNDVDGYARAIAEFDAWLPTFTAKMKDGDILMITADHGCDPATESTDHSREYVPLLIYGNKVSGKDLGTLSGFSHIAATVCDLFNVNYFGEGESLADKL